MIIDALLILSMGFRELVADLFVNSRYRGLRASVSPL